MIGGGFIYIPTFFFGYLKHHAATNQRIKVCAKSSSPSTQGYPRFPPSIPIPCVFWFQTVKHDIEHQNTLYTFGSENCTIYRHNSFLHIFILISKSPIKFQMINVFEPYLCNFVFMCMIIHISLRHRDTTQNNLALHDTT